MSNIQEIADDSAQDRKLKVQDMESIRRAVEESDIRSIHPDKMENGQNILYGNSKLNFHTYLCMVCAGNYGVS